MPHLVVLCLRLWSNEAQARRKRHSYPDLRACVILLLRAFSTQSKRKPSKEGNSVQSCRFLVLSTVTKTLGAFTPVVAFFAVNLNSFTGIALAMSDKGGHGFSLPNGKGVKSSLKSTTPVTKDASIKGKDDSSTKSKKGRNVQFASEGSKFDKSAAASTKANSGSSGGKREPEPLQLKVENELPKGAKCLMDCEAAYVLQGIQEQMIILSKDPTIKLPVSFDRGLQYTKRSTHYTDPESVRQVLENLKKYGVSDGEICVIANVYPETTDEVFALLPSLKARRIMLDDPVKEVLSELAKLKKST